MLLKIKKIIKQIIPYQYHFFLFSKSRKYVNESIRKEQVKFNLSDHVYLQVYWKIYGIGKGPALIFNAFEEEAIRFDFYGVTGHFHITVTEFAPHSPTLLWLKEKTVIEQIDRAIFELENNLYWYLSRHPLKKVRNLKVNKVILKEALTKAKRQLLEYENKTA